MSEEAKTLKGLRYLEKLADAETAVVLFHGYGASMADLRGLGDYLPHKVDWYFPDGPLAVDLGFMMEGRAWFPIDMAEVESAMATGSYREFEDKVPPHFEQSRQMTLEFLSKLRPKYKRLIVGGFSQGAMLASHIFSPAQADGLVVFSGVLVDKASLTEGLQDGSGVEFLQTHGKRDPLLEFRQGQSLFNFLCENGHKGNFVEFDGAHEIPQSALEAFSEYLKKFTRP